MKDKNIAIIGLGYVGLPLALLCAERGYCVTGVDSSEAKIVSLQKGKSYIDDISDAAVSSSKATFTTSMLAVKDADIIVVCVPTPVTEGKIPDLSPLNGAVSAIAPHMKGGVLLAIESTINPGVCDDVIIPLVESLTRRKVGDGFDVVHCPERINPGDKKWNVRNISRVIGGSSPAALKRGMGFYESLIEGTVKPMGSLKEAEAVKVVENAFRDVNIAFVNELAMAFHHLNIDLENVIDGAATKPFSFMPHRPGCGVGGHCIPVDPYYLIEYSRSHGFEHEFLRIARETNEHMPAFTVSLLEELLQNQGQTLKGTKVALLGLSYKANVGDDRESPSHILHKLLVDAGADVVAFDPFIPQKSNVTGLEVALNHADAILIATAHGAFTDRLTPELLQKHSVKVMVDGRNAFRKQKADFKQAGIAYVGIGQ